MKIREREELHTTTDRALFNKLNRRKIVGCPICGPNVGCNGRTKKKDYGGIVNHRKGDPRSKKLRYPSWKLATKNRRQWMAKELRVTSRTDERWYGHYTYITIKF